MAKAFSFGAFELLPDRNLLLQNGAPVRLGSRAFQLLSILVENAGQIVKSEELSQRVWPDTTVSDSNLRVHLAAVRKALKDPDSEVECIVTAPGRGYHFALPVTERKDSLRQRSNSNLPTLLTRLIGRDAVVQEILQNLENYRFVSIVGSGGIGKTSVALAAAQIANDRYEDGLCFVDFAPLNNPASLPSATARALKMSPSNGTDESAVIEHLRNRRPLIIFDNCEHLIQASALLAESILRNCPEVSLLITSREPLRAEGEYVRRLLPLTSPPLEAKLSASQAMEFSAVQLFVQRASCCLPGFILKDRDADALAQLCAKLDGIPLAIELAAARVDILDIRRLADKLDDSLQVLTRGRRTAQERHRTLRATLDWSFELLPESEQLLLARLGVFRSAFDADAAVAVTADQIIGQEQALEGLENLVMKSLLVVSSETDSPIYRLLETTRAYAMEKLGSGPAANCTRKLHAVHVGETLQRISRKADHTSADKHDFYSRIIDESRAAIDWAFSPNGDVRFGVTLVATSAFLWSQLSLFEEYRHYAERALAAIRDIPDCATTELDLLNAIAPAIYETLGAVPELYASARRVVDLASTLNAPAAMRGGLHTIWRYHHGRGEYQESLVTAEQIQESFEANPSDEHWWKPLKGLSLLYLGKLREGLVLLTESEPEVPVFDTGVVASYDYNYSVIVNGTLARILWLQGAFDEAFECVEAAVNSAVKAKQTVAVCFALSIAGCSLHLWSKDFDAAEQHLALLENYAARSRSIYWGGYVSVFRIGLLKARGETPAHPFSIKAEQKYWDYRHWENFSVLGEGFAPRSFVERAHTDRHWWCSAEILRLEALRLYHEEGDPASDDVCALLREALAIAQEQGALAWELRIARTLLEIADNPDEVIAASRKLRETMDEFTEGFSFPDLKETQALLESVTRFA